MRRNILERFREEHGDKRIALIHKKAIQAILNKKTPAAALNWRKALRPALLVEREDALWKDLYHLPVGEEARCQACARGHIQALCVPKTISELMTRWNHLSCRDDRALLFRSGRLGVAIQVEVTASS
jgi:hypothetical protein